MHGDPADCRDGICIGGFHNVGMCSHHFIMHYASHYDKRLLHYPVNYALCMSTPNERLRIARLNAGFETATDAAEALGIPRATYIGHENGHRGFPASRAPQYARKFKVAEEWLLYGKGSSAARELQNETVSIPVSLPSAAALTSMFRSMLDQTRDVLDLDERAQMLARMFPGTFRAALSPQMSTDDDEGNARAAPFRAAASSRS